MKTRKVIVLPYDEAWKTAFEAIKAEIESALGELILGIEHVGSTSVEGMSGKPCIDIDVIIKDYSIFDEVLECFYDGKMVQATLQLLDLADQFNLAEDE